MICAGEKLRPCEPIEGFLRLVVDNDSALSALRIIREAVKTEVEGVEAYARVLLGWYKGGKFWVSDAVDDKSVELLLLDALKVVSSVDLRRQIEEVLIKKGINRK